MGEREGSDGREGEGGDFASRDVAQGETSAKSAALTARSPGHGLRPDTATISCRHDLYRYGRGGRMG